MYAESLLLKCFWKATASSGRSGKSGHIHLMLAGRPSARRMVVSYPRWSR
ncbi:hypothetical protein TRAPUB_6225 [Trametes pubescens]|uniref:Uncharacterized protein n=1 Tax=Trametes pubescens TaxID=154538 RepID=A0A1M2V6K2_TRAPU|nr:hypothetical protein TRAPUB_6225 [Trametes pubescens]